MRFRHILAALSEPQLILPSAAASIIAIIQARMQGGEMPQREGQGFCGETIIAPGMEMIEGTSIAMVPVDGVMGIKLSGMEKGSGAVDSGDILDELDFCESSPDIEAVIMNFDTPGGMYQGTPELGKKINSMTKPVIGLIQNAHSAGMWVASCCDVSLMLPSGSAGCIGVYMGFHDVTEMLNKQGIKAELFTSGQYKGMGFPGVPLTESQRELLQENVMKLNSNFQNHITSMLGPIPKSAMQGQCFGPEECLELGLCDDIVNSMTDAVTVANLMIHEKSLLTISRT